MAKTQKEIKLKSINLKIGEENIELSFDEAVNLYNELSKYFGYKSYPIYIPTVIRDDFPYTYVGTGDSCPLPFTNIYRRYIK